MPNKLTVFPERVKEGSKELDYWGFQQAKSTEAKRLDVLNAGYDLTTFDRTIEGTSRLVECTHVGGVELQAGININAWKIEKIGTVNYLSRGEAMPKNRSEVAHKLFDLFNAECRRLSTENSKTEPTELFEITLKEKKILEDLRNKVKN